MAFGSIGIPVVTLAGVTGLPLPLLSAMVGRLCALVSDGVAAAAACAGAARLCGGGTPQAAAGVLVVPKTAPTPERYPRRAGVVARRPLRAE